MVLLVAANGTALHSTPTRGGSGGLVWISSSPWRNPSAGAGSEVEGSLEVESLGAESWWWSSPLPVVFVSIAGWSEQESAGAFGSATSSVDSTPTHSVSSCSSPTSSSLSSSSSLAATPLPHSLSFSDGGQVEVGVTSSPSSLAPSSVPPPVLPLRGLRCILWWRTRLCFRVKVRAQVWQRYGRSPVHTGSYMQEVKDGAGSLVSSHPLAPSREGTCNHDKVTQ